MWSIYIWMKVVDSLSLRTLPSEFYNCLDVTQVGACYQTREPTVELEDECVKQSKSHYLVNECL